MGRVWVSWIWGRVEYLWLLCFGRYCTTLNFQIFVLLQLAVFQIFDLKVVSNPLDLTIQSIDCKLDKVTIIKSMD